MDYNLLTKAFRFNVKLTERIYYNVVVNGKEVMWYSPISMKTNQGDNNSTQTSVKNLALGIFTVEVIVD